MYNVQTTVLVYPRVLIGGDGGHLDWQVLRAPQYVNPALVHDDSLDHSCTEYTGQSYSEWLLEANGWHNAVVSNVHSCGVSVEPTLSIVGSTIAL